MLLHKMLSLIKKARSDSRVRLALFDSATRVISSLLAFVTTFLSVSLTIDYLGEERFGVWMAINSITMMLTFLDLGVGNGLVSQVASSRVKSDPQSLPNTVTRGLSILIIIGIAVGLGFSAFNAIFPIADMLNVESAQAREDATYLVYTFIALFTLSIPASGLSKVLLGLQLGWIVNSTRCAGSILTLILIYFLSENEADPWLLLIAGYGVLVLLPFMMLPFFVTKGLIRWQALSNWQEAKAEYRRLMGYGGLFLALQIGVMIGWGADAFIIATLASASAVAQYAIAQRLFQFVSVPVNILNSPLWGAYADAHAQGDAQFIARTLRISLLGTLLLSAALSLGVWALSGWILHFWIGEHTAVSPYLILAFAIWKILQSVGHSFSMALNGMHIVKVQVVSVSLLCLLALPLKLWLTPVYGATGLIWITIIAYFFSTVVFYIWVFRSHLLAAMPWHSKAAIKVQASYSEKVRPR